MRRLFFSGIVFCGFMLLLTGSLVSAQDDDEREYVGSRECSSCHSDLSRTHQESPHALALISARDDDFFVADFDAGEDIRTVTFPDDDEARAFEMDDVAYALGSGRYVQRYLYEVDRDEYAVLPAEWNTVTEEWQSYGPVENWPDDPAYNFAESCIGCHTTGINFRRGEWEDDGVQCEACHGPGSVHVEEAEDAGRSPSDRELRQIREAIVVSPDAQICGQCHTQGTEPEDNHPFPMNYLPGGDLLDEDVFVPVPEDDPAHWWATGHASRKYMQFNEWLKSGHAEALSAVAENENADDTCLQCHSSDFRFTQARIEAVEEGEREGDPPDPVTVESAQFGITCTTCHNPHADPEETVFLIDQDRYSMCVQCHTDMDMTDGVHYPVQQMHEGQDVVETVVGIPSAHFTAEDGPDCVTCHLPRVPTDMLTRASHTFDPVLPGEALNVEGLQDSCSTCHSEQIEAVGLQAFIDDVQASTESRVTTARDSLNDDTGEWVMVALDFVETDGSWGVHNYAYTDALLDRVEAELGLNIAPPPDVNVLESVPDTITADTTAAEETTDDDDSSSPSAQAIAIAVISLALLAFAGWVFFFKQGDAA
ncbi:MAG: cytochrome c3 family protein [Anaerolineae bacterium]|nr:cytochrome c3 family protein [Anaerolineae bacterium]